MSVLLRLALGAGVLLLSPASGSAAVAPAPIIAEGMVLQREGRAPLFGTASPGEKISATFRGQTVATTAGKDGAWKLPVPAGAAGGPFPLVIQGQNRIELKSVWVGDVWLCSGQSNMVWTVANSTTAAEARKAPPDEQLRLCRVAQDGTVGSWQGSSPAAALPFSAVAYHFGQSLRAAQKVPIGLIVAAVGGTAIERWMPEEAVRRAVPERPVPKAAGLHYRAMVKPLQPFALRGVTWYQGEANASAPAGYEELLAELIRRWRRDWDQKRLPFLLVQLARYGKAGAAETEKERGWAVVREAQRRVLALPETGMAVSFDLTDGDLHPRDKASVAQRLARVARRVVYGEELEHSGPVLQTVRRDGDRLVLHFRHAEGLTTRDGPLRELEVRAGKGGFRPTLARIEGDRVIIYAVSSEPGASSEGAVFNVGELPGPLAIRYGWRAYPEGNLYNAAGLPASPFLVEGVE
ncbi:MAG: sialate O-acetylesterase [Armatimonadota bacterium]